MLSERGFTSWASGPVSEAELLAEYAWMARLADANKTYYSINEVESAEWDEAWIEWVIGAFMVGQTNTSALWLGTVQGMLCDWRRGVLRGVVVVVAVVSPPPSHPHPQHTNTEHTLSTPHTH